MPDLLIVGAGLFGSQAAAYARRRGIRAQVFDPGLPGAASPAAAGLFQEAWAGKKLQEHFRSALPVLEELYGLETLTLHHDDGSPASYLFVPPRKILEKEPIRKKVTALGDGWLEAEGQRYQGWVYLAAGIWCRDFLPDLEIIGKAGAAFLFPGERPGRVRPLSRGKQAYAFVRDPGITYFSDGTAEEEYHLDHDHQTLQRAQSLGLAEAPREKLFGFRPYTPGGALFRKLANRTWLATGARKMGTILGAAFARRLVEELSC